MAGLLMLAIEINIFLTDRVPLFRHCATFSSPKGPPSILLKSPFVIPRVKRYIRTIDVIS